MVSVWDQLLKGLEGVLIQVTFCGVEKGTDIIRMVLEQGNFYWPGYNRRNQTAGAGHAGRPCGAVKGTAAVEMGQGSCWGGAREHTSSTCRFAWSRDSINVGLFLLSSPHLMAVI